MRKSEVIENIFGYQDFRLFLKDYFAEQKSINPVFSMRWFTHKAGFVSPSFCNLVIKGERNLTENSTDKIVKAIGLLSNYKDFFTTLVNLNQTKDENEREVLQLELDRISKTENLYHLSNVHNSFFDKWYYIVVRELAVNSSWAGDMNRLSKMVRPRITVDEAQEAIDTLLELKMLKIDENGKYIYSDGVVVADNVPTAVVKGFMSQMLVRTLDAYTHIDKSERYISGATVSLSKENYSSIIEDIEKLRNRILAISDEEQENSEVYQINFNLFPMSNKERK